MFSRVSWITISFIFFKLSVGLHSFEKIEDFCLCKLGLILVFNSDLIFNCWFAVGLAVTVF